MFLYKDGMKKDLSAPKVIARWKRFGWAEEETEQPVKKVVENPQSLKKRGRPAKKED